MRVLERTAYVLIFGCAALAVPTVLATAVGVETALSLVRTSVEPTSNAWLGAVLFVATPVVLMAFAVALLSVRPFPLLLSAVFAGASGVLVVLSLALPSDAPVRALGYVAGVLVAVLILRARTWAAAQPHSGAV